MIAGRPPEVLEGLWLIFDITSWLSICILSSSFLLSLSCDSDMNAMSMSSSFIKVVMSSILFKALLGFRFKILGRLKASEIFLGLTIVFMHLACFLFLFSLKVFSLCFSFSLTSVFHLHSLLLGGPFSPFPLVWPH